MKIDADLKSFLDEKVATYNTFDFIVVNSFQNCIITQHSHPLQNISFASTVVNSFQNCIFTQHSKTIFTFLKLQSFKIAFFIFTLIK